MEITPQVLEIVTGRPERLNNRAANAYVVSGKGLSARRDPASQGTYFFIRFWVGKVNSCASVTALLFRCKNTELRLACFQLPASANGGRIPYLIPDRHIGYLSRR